MRHPDVEPELRGTYGGVAHPAVVEHLLALGVTAVELLPVHQFVHKRFLLDRACASTGATTRSASSRRTTSTATSRRSSEWCATLHAAGLEVILDVVFNHTGEGGSGDPTLCFRGIDNRTYYLHHEDDDRPPGRRLQRHGQHDGLRAPAGRSADHGQPALLGGRGRRRRLPLRPRASDARRSSATPPTSTPPTGEDVLRPPRRFLRSRRAGSAPRRREADRRAVGRDVGGLPGRELPAAVVGVERPLPGHDARLLAERRRPPARRRRRGSPAAPTLRDDGRLPYASVNFVTAHDGFTLADLVSYDEKHNDANGEGNRDGANDNRSWNCGAEGPTDDEAVRALRARQQRNFIASLALSQGTPMLLGGDEIGRTQQGNNNAYCQDNAIAWYDWELDDERRELLAFARRAFALRREHPVLRQRHWPAGITWLTPDGREMQGPDWQAQYARAVGMLLTETRSAAVRRTARACATRACSSCSTRGGNSSASRSRTDPGRCCWTRPTRMPPPGRARYTTSSRSRSGRRPRARRARSGGSGEETPPHYHRHMSPVRPKVQVVGRRMEARTTACATSSRGRRNRTTGSRRDRSRRTNCSSVMGSSTRSCPSSSRRTARCTPVRRSRRSRVHGAHSSRRSARTTTSSSSAPVRLVLRRRCTRRPTGFRRSCAMRDVPGGQASYTDRIENFFGFPDGIGGAELARLAGRQAEQFGAELTFLRPVQGSRLNGRDEPVSLLLRRRLRGHRVRRPRGDGNGLAAPRARRGGRAARPRRVLRRRPQRGGAVRGPERRGRRRRQLGRPGRARTSRTRPRA